MKNIHNRYHFIDSLRGLAIISMVLYHFCYDIFIVYGISPQWHRIPWVRIWQQSICCTFIFVSGISWHFLRKKCKQGLVLNFWGLVITGVTLVFMPSETIWFGILNFMGCAVFAMLLTEPLAKRITPWAGLSVSIFAFLFTRRIAHGILGIGGCTWFTLPDWLYQRKVLTILGFPYPSFSSSDYFPLLPWFFLYLAGYFTWPLIQEHSMVKRLRIPGAAYLGARSLLIYLLHQPVCMALATALYPVLR